MRVLLIEPGYRNKYPPLGLMKISTYHKMRGDYALFGKGCVAALRQMKWDRVYVSTLFTFYWKTVIDTIRYYQQTVESPAHIFVGGVMATLLYDDVRLETGATVIKGLLNRSGMLDAGDKTIIDLLPPDYGMLKDIDYRYDLEDAYIGYATRGCPNRCKFCAVNRIEPEFCGYLPLKRQVQSVVSLHGPKQNMVLLDNNVLASDQFARIIADIMDLGFEKGARANGRHRSVDFNQGVDIRHLTPEKMKLLSMIAIRPLRLAFDHIRLKDKYVSCIRQAVKCGITHLSNYVLYNYTDTPYDFYERLRINVELNRELGVLIYSFPMKFIPLDAKDRSYVGKHWSRRLLRGVQCILLATMGKVGTNLEFFEAAFGRTVDEFLDIAMMPENYIVYRERHKRRGAARLRKALHSLCEKAKLECQSLILRGDDGLPALRSKFPGVARHYEKKGPDAAPRTATTERRRAVSRKVLRMPVGICTKTAGWFGPSGPD